MKELAVIVCGGRDYNDYSNLCKLLDEVAPTFIIHGGANGADSLAGQYASQNNIPCKVFKAEWDKHGKGAGPIRNAKMLNSLLSMNIDKAVVAFPGGKGTANMISLAEDFNVKVIKLEQFNESLTLKIGVL